MKKYLIWLVAAVVLGGLGTFIKNAMYQQAIDRYTKPTPQQDTVRLMNQNLDGTPRQR